MTTIEDANFALQKVLDAGSQKNVIELAWIKNVRVTIPRVIVTLSLPSFANSQRDRILINFLTSFFMLVMKISHIRKIRIKRG